MKHETDVPMIAEDLGCVASQAVTRWGVGA
jgi:hypothetical protein